MTENLGCLLPIISPILGHQQLLPKTFNNLLFFTMDELATLQNGPRIQYAPLFFFWLNLTEEFGLSASVHYFIFDRRGSRGSVFLWLLPAAYTIFYSLTQGCTP